MSTATNYETVICEVEDGIARVTLNRPDSLNAWDEQLGIDLLAALEAAAADPEVRVVAITGAGRAFSSGADLRSIPATTDDGKVDLRRHLVERYNPIMVEIRGMDKPVVAVVNGVAAGIGCSLAVAADLIVAAESSFFLLAFANIGLTLDGGASAFLAARLGYSRTAELAMLADRLPARKAHEWGLVNEVAADDELQDVADALLKRLAAGATRSFASSKRLINKRLYPDLEGTLALEADLQQEMAESEDFIEGVTAFMQKRDPQFRGR